MQQVSFTSNKPYLFRAIYEWLLDNDATPYILVDASLPNVEVPNEHIQNGQIVLNASPSAIRNWAVDNEALSFDARFSGKSRQIYVPMNSILAIYAQENGLGMAFPSLDEGNDESALNQELGDEQSTEIEAEEVVAETKVETKPFQPEVIDSEKGASKRERSKSTSHLKIVK